MAAAAKRWNVGVDQVEVASGKIKNKSTNATLSYQELASDSATALQRVLAFLNQSADPALVHATVQSANEMRSARGIRTGQEGNFWDHLQPDEIFDIQEQADRGLSNHAVHLLQSMGVEVDPFPRNLP